MRSRPVSLLAAIVVASLAVAGCEPVEMEITVPRGGLLEDAILIVSADGDAPRETEVLGDIDLSKDSLSLRMGLDEETSTHWWIIGHIGDDPVFTSRSNLSGSNLYSVPPYRGVSRHAWQIPININALASGTQFDREWWRHTLDNHGSHATADGAQATLWRFSPTATSLGRIRVNLFAAE